MRKGTHKLTGDARAVKIMSKSHLSKEEKELLVNEVEELKKLVIFYL